MRAALVGNYGVGNLGDEALKDYFLHAFRDVEWSVLSERPGEGEYARLPAGFRSFIRFRWIRTLSMLRTVDAVVFGGGSLFTDVESPFACFLWWLHVMAASLFRKPVVLAFQGMGPYRTKVGEWFARSVVRKAAFISVRDEESFRRINSWTKNTKVVQTFDPVFSLMIEKKGMHDPKNVFVVIPRNNTSSMFLQNVYQELENATWEEVRVVLMEGDHNDERMIGNDILSKVDPRIGHLQFVRSLDELMQTLQNAKLLLSQRFHGALAGVAAGVPTRVFPQGVGDKLSIAAGIASQGGAAIARLQDSIGMGEEELRTWFSSVK